MLNTLLVLRGFFSFLEKFFFFMLQNVSWMFANLITIKEAQLD